MSSFPKVENATGERKATWLELFFDLIFVVAIAKATHVLMHSHHGHLEPETYFKYALIMIPIWWAWTGCTLFSNRFYYDDILQRLMSFGQMFCIIILATHISTDFDEYYKGFLLSYAAIRLITVVMYLRASVQAKNTRPISNYLAAAFTIGIIISLSSLFFDGIQRYIILYAGIGFDMIMPLIAKKRLSTVPVHANHLPERFGLLTIIMFGESVLSLANSFDTSSWSSLSIAMACCGFLLICALWWIYFDSIERRISGKDLGNGQGIIYSHLFIYMGLGGIAAMIRFAVVPELTLFDYKVLLGFSMISFMISLQFLHFVYHPKDIRKHLVGNAFLFHSLFLVLLFIGPSLPILMAGTTLLVLAYVAADYYKTSQSEQQERSQSA